MRASLIRMFGRTVPLAVGGGGAVAFDASTSAEEISGDGILSVTHTCNGSNRALFVGVGWQQVNAQSTSCTYDGNTMSERWDVTGGSTVNRHAGYTRAVEADGTGSKTITSTLGDTAGGMRHWIGVISLTGVDQTTPTGSPVTASGTTSSPATVDATDASADDIVVDVMVAQAVSFGSIGADQTLAYQHSQLGTQFFRGSYQDGVDGGVMSWNINSPDYWGIGAIAFKPAS